MKNKKASRKELITCIQSLLKRDWECEWDGRFGKNPTEVAIDILEREKRETITEISSQSGTLVGERPNRKQYVQF